MKVSNSLIHTYKNGNYFVSIFDDGSKVRYTDEDEFVACFPESIDMKITNYCDSNCPMCHELSNKDGKHASFEYQFLKTLMCKEEKKNENKNQT